MKARCRPCDVEQAPENPPPPCFCCGKPMVVVPGNTFGQISAPVATTVAHLLAL